VATNNNVRRRLRSPRRQQGVALIALTVLLALLGIGLVLEALSARSQNTTGRERISREVLAQAKADLIAWSVSHPTEPGRLPWPDRNADGNYDGQSDCVTSGFSNAHLLGRFPQAGDATPCDVVPFGSFAADGYGEPLWYAVSRNLLWNRGQGGADPPVNPGLLDGGASYPWLTVRDQYGNVLSNRVAAVIIAPGGVVANQARGGAAPNPDEYLDSVTVSGTPYDNSDADLDFIIYPDSSRTVSDSDSFNDQLIYVTIDELMRPVEKRVLGDAAVALQAYRTTRGRYPWLSPYRDPLSASGGVTLTGRIEAKDSNDITDNDANFPPSIGNGDLIVNVTRRTFWVVDERDSSIELDLLSPPHDFEVGDAYNLLPAFNGIWGQREGHVPYIDSGAGESHAVATGFTLSWNNGTTSPAPSCTPPTFPAWLSLTALGCTQLQGSYQSGSFVQPQPTVPTPAAANGECIWTDIDSVDCYCHSADCDQATEVRSGAYVVEVCVSSCGSPFFRLVERTYTYSFDFTGSGATTSVGNVKTRRVTNTSPETIVMQDKITVSGTDYVLWSGTVTVPAGSYVMDGIYFDVEDGNEFPVYFFTNLWHHYIYAKIAADHVAVNTISGSPSTDDCVTAVPCVDLDIGGSTIRNDVQAVLVGAGGQLAGQNRANGGMGDYFEDSNATQANDTVDRGIVSAVFNDQVRVIRPNPP
jgi:type II secretory pathway pseudopilin PulG